jgi:hypothetical protein
MHIIGTLFSTLVLKIQQMVCLLLLGLRAHAWGAQVSVLECNTITVVRRARSTWGQSHNMTATL